MKDMDEKDLTENKAEDAEKADVTEKAQVATVGGEEISLEGLTHEQQIDIVCRKVFEKYRKAFEELAKH
ncbi:MAG: hypothetical protein NC033_05555 [Clostridiales bacterium]|nr:hypothetical protein [Clostridiales bacterium]